jgi:phage shock protein PspC (stress-responsive transcriptional regulator)
MSTTQTGRDGIEGVVKDFWASRPRRPRYGRKIAGVAEGIGNRYAVDPVIVRVALVVTALFGGAGVMFYLLGWLMLPEESDEVSPFEAMIGRGRSSTSTHFTVFLCIALIPACSWFFGNTWFAGGGFSGFLGAAGLFAALFLLHQNRGHLNRPQQVGTTTSGGSMYGSTSASAPMETAERTGWDPLGAAPLAWDLPDPAPPTPAPQPPRPRSKVTPITLGLALLVGVIGLALAATTDSWVTEPAHIAGAMLAVVGLGMIAGASVRGGGRGLVGPAVILGVIGVGLSTTGVAGWHGTGKEQYAPTSLSAVQDRYLNSAGSIDLDLTGLPGSGNVNTAVQNSFGDVRVRVPSDADVQAHCYSKFGEVNCLDQSRDGIGNDLRVTDNGDDGPGGLKITLDARTSAGSVEVIRD